jgi:hypothetical protein
MARVRGHLSEVISREIVQIKYLRTFAAHFCNSIVTPPICPRKVLMWLSYILYYASYSFVESKTWELLWWQHLHIPGTSKIFRRLKKSKFDIKYLPHRSRWELVFDTTWDTGTWTIWGHQVLTLWRPPFPGNLFQSGGSVKIWRIRSMMTPYNMGIVGKPWLWAFKIWNSHGRAMTWSRENRDQSSQVKGQFLTKLWTLPTFWPRIRTQRLKIHGNKWKNEPAQSTWKYS